MTAATELYFYECPDCHNECQIEWSGPLPSRLKAHCWYCRLPSIIFHFEHESERNERRRKLWVPPPPTEYDMKQVSFGLRWQDREERGEYRNGPDDYYKTGTLPKELRWVATHAEATALKLFY